MSHHTMLRFSIAQTDDGWAWKTVSHDGRCGQEGLAASKQIAAALIIRSIVRQVCSGQQDGAAIRKAA